MNTGAWIWLVLSMVVFSGGWIAAGSWQDEARAQGWPPGTGLYAAAPLLLLLAWLAGFAWACS